MLRIPHVVTELSSIKAEILNERKSTNVGTISSHLAAEEAGAATSVEKAFVNLRFNDLSTSAHAGDSVFSRSFSHISSVYWTLLTLSRSHKGDLYETPEMASRG